MRFATLGLERYGRFTDRLLEFDPQARLTIVHGANEAGKTTALAAVADVLFGVDERSRFNFLHDYKTMRLSARIVGGDGRTLSFARLKRRIASLVDPATDAPLGEDCLAPFVGAYERRSFVEIFGLDQQRLRAGGKQLLDGGGDLAETLLAAAPGLDHVIALRDRLKESAAQTFNQGRKTASHAFYRALEKRTQALRLMREAELRVDEVKKLREAADEAAALRRQAVERDIETVTALAHAQMLMRAASELRWLDRHLAARDRLGALPAAPPGFCARAREALAQLEKAREAHEFAARETARQAETLAGMKRDDAILGLADRIESCDGERAAVEKELQSLPKRRNEAMEAGAALKRIAAALGLADVAALLERLPGAPQLARAEKFLGRLQAAALRATQLDADRASLDAQREASEKAGAALGHVLDPAPLKRHLAALDGAEDRERMLRAEENRLLARRQALEERLRRAGLAAGDPDSLAALPLPALAAAQARLREAREAAEATSREARERDEIAEALARAMARLAALHAGRPAPTEAAIHTARRTRDDLWAGLRGLALRRREAGEADAETALRLDRAIAEADVLADVRQTETKRLADLSRTELDIAELRARLDASAARVAKAEASAGATRAAWAALWSQTPLAPAPEESAIGLLREAEAICAMRETQLAEAAEALSAREAVRSDRAEAERLRGDLGLPPQGDGALRLADLRETIAELDSRFQQARDQQRDLARLQQAATEIMRREQELLREKAALAGDAAEILPPLAIRASASVEEARAALELWREALTLAAALEAAERRANAIEADEKQFCARIGELCGEAGAGMEAGPFVAARQMRLRLDAARAEASKAEAARETLQAREQAAAAALAALERGEAALGALLDSAGVAETPDLALLLGRLEEAATCEEQIAASRLRLAEICGSLGEAEIRAALLEKDEEALTRQCAEAEADHQTAHAERDRAIERDVEARSALARFEQREGAAGAAQEEQNAVAEIAGTIEDFTRDYVTARLLTAAIERYRAQHQNPIVERASQAFANLTCGAWSGVGVDYDQDPPRLAAIRDGRRLGVEALSEGTADQLFLALRIAAIQEHAQRAAPLPFICDDLFVTFDEARTTAGLSALAELGAITQVIVFTHHDHVVRCARQALAQQAHIIAL